MRSFPVRTCSDTKFIRHERLGRPCLLFDIDRCSGPCVGCGGPRGLRRLRQRPDAVLSGDTEPILASLEAEMLAASDALQFERAARLRDRITAVHKAAETQQMVSDRAEDFDVVGLAEDPLEASVQIFRVRRGRVVGHRGFVAEKVEDLSGPEFMARSSRRSTVPTAPRCHAACWCPRSRPIASCSQSWLRTLRGGPGRHRGARSAGQARPARDGDPLGQRGPGPPPAAPGRRSQRPVQGADRAAGRAVACARPPCASSAST